ncbi:MAG: hypothetical protein JXA60_10655 [Candidatus Coatesbacteria bacterium]|nr:hypothetical protein [Candidatus Coatesbacteria bacterium]
MKRLITSFIFLLLLFSFSGCGKRKKPKEVAKKDETQQVVAKVPQQGTPEQQQQKSMLDTGVKRIYKAGGINGEGAMRDPFASLLQKSGVTKEGEINLEGMRLVGVIGGTHGKKALLQDVEGNGYIVRAGDKIGGGNVSNISDNEIIIEQEELGIKYQVSLKLEKKGKEDKSYGKSNK